MRSLLSRIGAEDLPRDSAMCGEGNVTTFSNASYLNELRRKLDERLCWSTPPELSVSWAPFLRIPVRQPRSEKFLVPMS